MINIIKFSDGSTKKNSSCSFVVFDKNALYKHRLIDLLKLHEVATFSHTAFVYSDKY